MKLEQFKARMIALTGVGYSIDDCLSQAYEEGVDWMFSNKEFDDLVESAVESGFLSKRPIVIPGVGVSHEYSLNHA